MPIHVCDYRLPEGDRAFKRISLIAEFLKEAPGTGQGVFASKYQYNVEACGPYRIYLRRPTWLNKGFDFTVNIDGVYFGGPRTRTNRRSCTPRHQDVFCALAGCRTACPDSFGEVRRAIGGLYRCEEVDLAGLDADFRDITGDWHPIQILLLAIKWLFMEQDCAYWNYSGRAMLFGALREMGFA